MTAVEILQRADGERLAYRRRSGASPSVLWLGGFNSDMTGSKASTLDSWSFEKTHGFCRFDYFAHGQSSGDFSSGTISRWLDDALCVLDTLTTGPQVLVGSSMGGWISLLVQRVRPERVAGMLLIAPAPDFTERMCKELPEDAKRQIETQGSWSRPSAYDPEPYFITRKLLEDGRKNLVLNAPLKISCPVRILQGMRDADVPWSEAIKLSECIEGDVRVTLVKDGDHRLSTPPDLLLLVEMLESLLKEISPNRVHPG